MKQLYANNAKTTLTTAITSSSTTLSVADGSLFPTPAANEFFLVTLESGTTREIVQIGSKSGNILTVASGGRGQEGFNSGSFPVGTLVDGRVTAGTLARMSTAFVPLSGVEALVAPSNMYNNGFICGTVDPTGIPIMPVVKNTTTWKFLNYTTVFSSTVTSGTSTNITTNVPFTDATSTKYLIQFISGTLTGYVRPITAMTSTLVSWVQALPSSPASGVSYEILQANTTLFSGSGGTSSSPDDAIVMALIFGGN